MTAPAPSPACWSALGLGAGAAVLEIGTGSATSSALLAKLGWAGCGTSERYAPSPRAHGARLRLAGLGDSVTLTVGDGLAAGEDAARYDRILVNGAAQGRAAAADVAPRARAAASSGALAADGLPRLARVERGGDGQLRYDLGPPLRIAPLTAGRAVSL
jgi:protein-L-isoaspartate(D-aspartate) O-methyltransferase